MEQDITLIVVLAVLVPLVLLLLVILFRKYSPRKDRHRNLIYEAAYSGKLETNHQSPFIHLVTINIK